jgi:DNA repair exonuclease SbcCD ATPase subunit
MDTRYNQLKFLIKQVDNLTDDKCLLTGQLEASRNTSKNLDNECKDLVKEVNQLRRLVEELKTSLSQQHELRYYTSENSELQYRKEIQAEKQFSVAIAAYNNYNGIKVK